MNDPHPFASPQDEQELCLLLLALCAGELTIPARDRLVAILAEHPEYKPFCAQYLDMHARLLWRYREPAETPLLPAVPADAQWAAVQPAPVVTPAVAPVPGGAEQKTWPARLAGNAGSLFLRPTFWSILAVSVLLYGAFALISWDLRSRDNAGNLAVQPDPRPAEERDAFVGTAVATLDKTSRAEVREGEPLTLDKGQVNVRLKNGVTLMVEGPAEWSIERGNHAVLKQGRVLATVPPGAEGFYILTPTARVVDRGTRFAVQADEQGNTRVLVLQGRVDVAALGASQAAAPPRRLVANEALHVNATQTISVPAADYSGHFSNLILSHAVMPDREEPTYIAYVVPSGLKGDQDSNPNMSGMDFFVRRPIEITQLGVFDEHADGLNRKLTVALWSRDDGGTPIRPDDDKGGKLLATEVFTPEDPGTLIGGSRFKTLAEPLRLPAGAYTIAAGGFGRGEASGNRSRNVPWTLENGRGLIEFVGTGRDGPADKFPADINKSEVPNPFAAGTFQFRRAASQDP